MKEQDDPEPQWRIYLPGSMLLTSVSWFRQVLGQPGASRLYKTMSQCVYNSRLQHTSDTFTCDHCQKHKLPGKGHGPLPDKDIVSRPWDS